MEQIVIAMLFAYPGALAEAIRKWLFEKTYEKNDSDEEVRIAQYFVGSSVITVFSLLIYAALTGRGVSSLRAICASLEGTMEIMKYLLISLCVSFVFALILQRIRFAAVRVKSSITERKEGSTTKLYSNAWREIYDGADFERIRKHMILRITNENGSKAGFVKKYFSSFENGIVLTQTAAVEEYLAYDQETEKESRDPNDMWIGRPEFTLYHPGTGSFIEIFDGTVLSEYLDKELVKRAKENPETNVYQDSGKGDTGKRNVIVIALDALKALYRRAGAFVKWFFPRQK